MTSIGGCDVNRLYGTNIFGPPGEESDVIIERETFSLYAMASTGEEAPGITLIAQINDRPVPAWDWDEFKSWPQAKQESVYGDYYEQVYLSLSASHDSPCPIRKTSFDHRGMAQQFEYFHWLTASPASPRFREGAKGLFVEFPIAQCSNLLTRPDGQAATLTILIRNGEGEAVDEIDIRFTLELRDTSFDFWGI